ncbi:MAG: hypothetical protein AAF865_16865 [Pseudomonadota bacterium]
MTGKDPVQTNAELALLLRDRLGIRRGETLAAKLGHAGRLVPRPERAAGRALVEAERLWENPKLRRQVDPAALKTAETRLRRWLGTVDAAERRRGVLLGILATLAFNFLVLAAAGITYLWYSGRL